MKNNILIRLKKRGEKLLFWSFKLKKNTPYIVVLIGIIATVKKVSEILSYYRCFSSWVYSLNSSLRNEFLNVYPKITL